MADGDVTCPHPPSAHISDGARGQVTCGICGSVVADQQFELDQVFKGPVGGSAFGSALRTPGIARPNQASVAHGHHSIVRPSIEAARRQITAIGRQVGVPNDHVEIATGLFKRALNCNAVVGAKTAVLCACLYIVCRRQGTPCMIHDFADVTKDTSEAILHNLKIICRATHTTIPTIDPSFFVARFVSTLNIQNSELEHELVLYSIKVLRAMQQDWINAGRRPLGVCAAALCVSCHVFGISYSLSDLVNMIRLSGPTIIKRAEEFAVTPAGQLSNIDDYEYDEDATNPKPYVRARGKDLEAKRDSQFRQISALYYELAQLVRKRAPITDELQEKWRLFLEFKAIASKVSLDDVAQEMRGLFQRQIAEEEKKDAASRKELTPVDQLDPLNMSTLSFHQLLLVLGLRENRKIKAEQEDDNEIDVVAPANVEEAVNQAKSMLTDDGVMDLNEKGNAENQEVQLTSGVPASSPPARNYATDCVDALDLSDVSSVEEEYIIRDREERIKRLKAMVHVYHTKKWFSDLAANQPRQGNDPTRDQSGVIDSITDILTGAAAPPAGVESSKKPRGKTRAKKKRDREAQPASAIDNVRTALRSAGASRNIDASALEQLLPGANQVVDDEFLFE